MSGKKRWLLVIALAGLIAAARFGRDIWAWNLLLGLE